MTVQDDERERELVGLFNLNWDASHQRHGVDAVLELDVDGCQCKIEVEVKSTTGFSVGTARDVGLKHIAKWRNKLFVIGFYSKARGRPELEKCLVLTPQDMEPWIASIEEKIEFDYKLAECLSRKPLGLDDLFQVCGKQDSYTIKDAKRLHKQQWTNTQYLEARDMTIGRKKLLSQSKMLEILRLRSLYIAERGATLNNPHINKKFLIAFKGSDREFSRSNAAVGVREIASTFVRAYPNHPSILK